MQRFRNILLVANKATKNGSLSTAYNRTAAPAKFSQAKLNAVNDLEELPSDTSAL